MMDNSFRGVTCSLSYHIPYFLQKNLQPILFKRNEFSLPNDFAAPSLSAYSQNLSDYSSFCHLIFCHAIFATDYVMLKGKFTEKLFFDIYAGSL